MRSWQKVWREGFAPLMSRRGLESLAKALREDDQRLIQGATCSPPPMQCVQDWPVEQACAIGWCAWQGGDSEDKTVGDVEEFFARACYEADQRLGEPAACRYYLSWYDDSPLDVMRRELLPEVELAIQSRNDLCRL